MDICEIHDKIKGLADLLWAVAAQVESGTHLRAEGALMLAKIATDTERSLESLMSNNT